MNPPINKFKMSDEKKPGRRISKLRRGEIIGIVKARPFATFKEIQKLTKFNMHTVRAIAEDLEKRGEVRIIRDRSSIVILKSDRD